MIETGKLYTLITLEMGENGYHEVSQGVTFTKVEGSLVEIDGHTVLNLNSPMFHCVIDREAEKNHHEQAAKDSEINIQLTD
ncbi:hypothetical protein [Roseinatronobacter alkalisoli]|uniref:Uncharacterized protein n=1 Tax=Roseinatronobacter alkalisoli TaxID=3028235 RepID=A0ABT5T522_9RHOB|nr:hypothetical protein [Roseinatronobacter sp. HJB301]MDD7970214.1 hypothetical protein [Roseinatronobacter sp. HJB301]